MMIFGDKKEAKTLSEELALTLERDDVDELGFPRKRLTETQREYVNQLYKRESGSNGKAVPKSVIFDNSYKNGDPFGLKIYGPAIIDDDTPDSKWWYRWSAWLEAKRMEKEERKKRAKEQAKLISESMHHSRQQQQQRICLK